MEKQLVYSGITYNNFTISENGVVTNLKTGKICKPYIGAHGYYYVSLAMGKRGAVKTIRLHKAIAEAFIPNPNNYPIVHHKDENKTNYNIDNLEWTTAKRNTQLHIEKELFNNEFCNNRKLTADNVKYIRKNPENSSQRKLAQLFHVSKPVIANVIKGISYKEIK